MIADAVAALPNQRTIRPAIKMPLAGTPAALSRFDMRYARDMIRSFRCKDTGRLAAGHRVRRFVAIERVAQRKLAQLDAAATLDFLRAPPGNRLEALKGDRSGTYSIRINDQWRLCFRFEDGNAYDAEIVDYH